MRGRSVRVVSAVLALPLFLAGLAACGDSSTSSSNKSKESVATLVAAVPDATTKAGTARMALTADTQVLGRSVNLTGKGVFSFADHTGQFSFSIPSLIPGKSVDEILTADTLYIQLPGVGASGKYYAIDLKALNGGRSPLSQLGNTDPTASLEALRGASSDVHEVGTAKVRGVSTTHYQGTLDPVVATEKAPKFVRAKVRDLFKQVKTIPFDAYVDDAGRLRKLTEQLDVPASSATGGQAVKVATTFELYDYGTPVKVKAPPKDEQIDGSQLLQQLGGGAG